MMPRPARGNARQTAQREVSYRTYTFPGPSGGWVSDRNLTIAQPSCAYRLENIFPTATGGVLRRGCVRHADLTSAEVATKLAGTVSVTEGLETVAGTDTAFTSELAEGSKIRISGFDYVVASIADDTTLTLEDEAISTDADQDFYILTPSSGGPPWAMFSYDPSGANHLFAATDDGIWDISISADPKFVHNLTDGHIITAEYTTVDGVRYVRGVNGVDTPFLYDGTEFTDTPPLTFASPDEALTPDILSFVWVFKSRFFFIQKESLNVWYLPVGQIGGELTKFSLGGEFRRGGKLVFGATWSVDSGSGLASLCAFFTDQGEVAVFEGSNPSDAEAWGRVGVYMIGRPRGPRSFVQRGGDILVAADVGLIPLSSALQRDATTVALSAISAPIEDKWRDFIRSRPGEWPMEVWTANQMLVMALPPSINDEPPVWLVVNARTNKWCVYTGWNAVSVCVHGDRMFFGSPNGFVYEANVGANDDGATFTGVYVPVFDQLGAVGAKVVTMAKAVTRSLGPSNMQLTAQGDFVIDLPPPPDATPAISETSKWGASQWGSAKWGAGKAPLIMEDDWRHVIGDGEVLSISHQVTSGGLTPLDVDFIRTDVLFTVGGAQS